MSTKYARPKWWQVYLTFPLLIALFAVDSRLKLSIRGHQAIQIGIVLLVYGLIHAWLKANAQALSAMDQMPPTGKVRVLKIEPHELPMMNYEYKSRAMFQLLDSEIKGTLSDTFEMDTIDAEFISTMDEVHRN